jgi:hypothetical protein
MGVFESLGRIVLGPVAMVRVQKAGIKYKKPIGSLRGAQDAFSRDAWVGGAQNFGAVGAGPAD